MTCHHSPHPGENPNTSSFFCNDCQTWEHWLPKSCFQTSFLSSKINSVENSISFSVLVDKNQFWQFLTSWLSAHLCSINWSNHFDLAFGPLVNEWACVANRFPFSIVLLLTHQDFDVVWLSASAKLFEENEFATFIQLFWGNSDGCCDNWNDLLSGGCQNVIETHNLERQLSQMQTVWQDLLKTKVTNNLRKQPTPTKHANCSTAFVEHKSHQWLLETADSFLWFHHHSVNENKTFFPQNLDCMLVRWGNRRYSIR